MELNTDQNELIKKVAKENGFEQYKLEIEPGSNKGDNYLGIIKRITIKNEENELTLIMKIAQPSEKTRKVQPTRTFFLREIYMYGKVFEDYAAFEEENNVSNRFLARAKLYGTCDIDLSESLVFEDMKVKHFQMCNRKITMNSQHIIAVLKEYAKYHSIGLAMRYKEPERFKELSKSVEKDVFYSDDNEKEQDMNHFIEAVFENGFKAVEGDIVATEALQKYKIYLNDNKKNIINNNNPEDKVIITHGDCWCNNFLFKYKDENKEKPSEVCILDWQLSKLGSPAIDLSYFLFANASEEILNNYKTYLKIYYDVVCQSLKEFSCDPEEVFTYHFLESQFNKYTKYMLWMCFMLFKIFICESDESPDIQDELESASSEEKIKNIVNFKVSNIDEYNRRVSVLIHFTINNNLFD